MPTEDDPYIRPVIYDLEYADHDEDIDWYVRMAQRARGLVLDLGCGTGRLTLPMARAGASVIGVDRSPEMLRTLGDKLRLEDPDVRIRVRYKLGDFRDLDLQQRFALVLLPFNAIHHCGDLDEVRQVMAEIRGVLAPGGRVGFDCYLPDRELYRRNPDKRYEERTFTDPRTGGELQSWEQGWWDEETSTHHVVYTYEQETGEQVRAHLALRMFELGEIRSVIRQTPFTILSEYSDFEGGPVRPNSLKWVAILEAPSL